MPSFRRRCAAGPDDGEDARTCGALGHAGLTINELAVYAVVEQSTLSRTLEALEHPGLAPTGPDPSDSAGHARSTSPMPAAAAFDQLWPEMFAAYDEMFIGEAEKQAFIGQKVLKNVRTRF
jgi:DNA-binding MarR family transcriptional regulator